MSTPDPVALRSGPSTSEAPSRQVSAADDEAPPQMRRAVLLMTASSVLTPAVGLLTQPMLAQALGVEGRGQMAAALAPSLLVVSVATFGLPEALTYYIAKKPEITGRALRSAMLVSVLLGLVCLGLTYLVLPFLSAGDPLVADLTLLAVALTVPAMAIGALRGAAMGRQMWGTVAVERLVSTVSRLVIFLVLWPMGLLDPVAAVAVTAAAPIWSGVVFWRLLLPDRQHRTRPPPDAITRKILSFGVRIWFGAVASMLLSRFAQVLMAPLSDLVQLGLFTVATTVSDLPLVIAMAIQGALFGVSSQLNDAGKLTQSARLTLLASLLGCTGLALTVPFWLAPLFGAEFGDALVPTLLLLLSALICTPGLLAATGVSAWGRPGLRSIGLTVTLVVNGALFLVLVPTSGAVGASLASVVGNVVLTGFMVVSASRLMQVPARDFLLVRTADLVRFRDEAVALSRRIPRPRRNSRANARQN
ncbi:lipopolysaccharide biosynthesis protein [Pseudonocardia alni]|uniref:lipopolysaccharide biosynthesis protein n=1 Tax=Pseudonocardia alni TaxID=33907 RepID=UPI00279E0E4C|nr:oligosaccharide flippase family protein [Pseudonocardia alni]